MRWDIDVLLRYFCINMVLFIDIIRTRWIKSVLRINTLFISDLWCYIRYKVRSTIKHIRYQVWVDLVSVVIYRAIHIFFILIRVNICLLLIIFSVLIIICFLNYHIFIWLSIEVKRRSPLYINISLQVTVVT